MVRVGRRALEVGHADPRSARRRHAIGVRRTRDGSVETRFTISRIPLSELAGRQSSSTPAPTTSATSRSEPPLTSTRRTRPTPPRRRRTPATPVIGSPAVSSPAGSTTGVAAEQPEHRGFRHSLVTTIRSVLLGAAAGAWAGLLIGGIGGRVAMGVLRVTSKDTVRGRISDDGFEIGQVSVGHGVPAGDHDRRSARSSASCTSRCGARCPGAGAAGRGRFVGATVGGSAAPAR